MTVTYKVGIEAEFLPLKGGKPCDTREFYLPHDDFPALAEIRAEPGKSPQETYGNYAYLFTIIEHQCRRADLVPFYEEYNWSEDDYNHFCLMMGKMGKEKDKDKVAINWRNIYGKSIRPFNLCRGGGLHVHFSAMAGEQTLINRAVMQYIVANMDKTFGHMIDACKGPYRVPGMYEPKPWGFEYRSLPFNANAIGSMLQIVEMAHIYLRNATSTSF